MNIYYLLLVAFLFAFKTGKTQFIECQTDYGGYWADKYKITAKSGLKLRTEPTLNSQVVTIIPSEFEVRICERNSVRDTIDEIAGKWVKTYWREYEGFMFDGYLEEVAGDSLLEIIQYWEYSDEWKNARFEQGEEAFGIYLNEVKKIKLDHSRDKQFSYPLEVDQIPAFIIKNNRLDLQEGTRLDRINKMLFIGDHLYGYHNQGILYGNGLVTQKDSLDVRTFGINPYELRFQYQVYGEEEILEKRNELLVKMKYQACNLCGGRLYIMYIGDLDGDNKDDIIVRYNSTYKAWYYGLFSTKYAEEDRMFKELTIGQGSE